MQNIIIEKPYEFIPPYRGKLWAVAIRDSQLHRWYLRRKEAVFSYDCRHAERLRASLAAGHGVLLTPNHCRDADPLVLGFLAYEARCLFYAMASWHLFHQDWFSAWAIRRMGAFSVYREGVDRQAINMAVECLETGERPLVIFPEGMRSRTNDWLHALLDGVAFIARSAAKRRAKHAGGKVVVHPVGLKYHLESDLRTAVDPVLTMIEQRFSWRPRPEAAVPERIAKVGRALVGLKEIEIFGKAQTGSLEERTQGLIDGLLLPLETEWNVTPPPGSSTFERVKLLRMRILPDMVQSRVSAEERERRWSQLANIYLAQQVSCYPPGYLTQPYSVDRLLETVERLEEDLTDKVTMKRRLRVTIHVGEAIEVSPERDRKAEVDPLMKQIDEALRQILGELAAESPVYRA